MTLLHTGRSKKTVAAIATIPRLCCSVAAKPSPLGVKLHDAGYRALNLDFKYVAVGSAEIEPVISMVRTFGIRGLGVSMPHKIAVISYLDEVSEDVKAIGACNTVVNDDGRLSGHNTDWRGADAALAEAGLTNCRTALIVGAGGAARAIAYALRHRDMAVTVAARNRSQAETLVTELGLHAAIHLDDQRSREFELVVNATPVASVPDGPVATDWATPPAGVFDVVFQTRLTPLTTFASEQGSAAVGGWRMLLHQAAAQFQLYTDHAAPLDAMQPVLEAALPEH